MRNSSKGRASVRARAAFFKRVDEMTSARIGLSFALQLSRADFSRRDSKKGGLRRRGAAFRFPAHPAGKERRKSLRDRYLRQVAGHRSFRAVMATSASAFGLSPAALADVTGRQRQFLRAPR